ncbi:MAG: hypothetical protein QGG40_17155, partial [Myxococcota bacterium]|nr:hypothetical protein [Myxococcota bacterium]
MERELFAGHQLVERLTSTAENIERWRVKTDQGPAELFIGSRESLAQARRIPSWGPFPAMQFGEENGRSYVLVRGALHENLVALAERFTPGEAVAFGWHIAAALAEVHDHGEAHCALHPQYVGLDLNQRLVVLPALGSSTPDPDPTASAQARDCYQLGQLLQSLGWNEQADTHLDLVLHGLTRTTAKLRMVPGRSVRQAIAAVLYRHEDWEQDLVSRLGRCWALGVPSQAWAPTTGPRAATRATRKPDRTETTTPEPRSSPPSHEPISYADSPDGLVGNMDEVEIAANKTQVEEHSLSLDQDWADEFDEFDLPVHLVALDGGLAAPDDPDGQPEN